MIAQMEKNGRSHYLIMSAWEEEKKKVSHWKIVQWPTAGKKMGIIVIWLKILHKF